MEKQNNFEEKRSKALMMSYALLALALIVFVIFTLRNCLSAK